MSQNQDGTFTIVQQFKNGSFVTMAGPCYPAACPVTTFAFHFSAGDQLLLEHEWKNASPDRGGSRRHPQHEPLRSRGSQAERLCQAHE